MEKKYRTFASKMREDLYRKLKLLSAAEGKPIQTLLEEAVIEYIENRAFQENEMAVREDRGRYSISFDIPKEKKKPKK